MLGPRRLFPPPDPEPSLIDFAQTVPGKVCLLVAFGFGLYLLQKTWWAEASVLLAALSFWPRQRRLLLPWVSLYWFFAHMEHFEWVLSSLLRLESVALSAYQWEGFKDGCLLLAILIVVTVIRWADRHQGSPLVQRPVRNMFLAYVALVLLILYGPWGGFPRLAFVGILLALSQFFCVVAYFLADPALPAQSLRQRLSYPPFWVSPGWATYPIPKGPEHLKRVEARDDRELAAAQLKALKLLYWAYFLSWILHGLNYFSFGIPPFWDAVVRAAAGRPYPWYLNWCSLAARFAGGLLGIAVTTHVIVAMVRMAGFDILKHMHKPLRSRSIADFWNRYGYYEKEFLLTCFFYPAFNRYFKDRPRLRVAFAIFAAAGFGNFLQTYLEQMDRIIFAGPWRTFLQMRSYALYCLLLSAGIIASRLSEQENKSSDASESKSLTAVRVIGFYCLLSVFNDYQEYRPLRHSLAFLLSLFGWS